LDLTNPTVKQSIGRMVCSAIEPFGYSSHKQARMPLSLRLSFFKRAHIFVYTGNETQRIERQIVEVIGQN
jgi:hypothetical protein